MNELPSWIEESALVIAKKFTANVQERAKLQVAIIELVKRTRPADLGDLCIEDEMAIRAAKKYCEFTDTAFEDLPIFGRATIIGHMREVVRVILRTPK